MLPEAMHYLYVRMPTNVLNRRIRGYTMRSISHLYWPR